MNAFMGITQKIHKLSHNFKKILKEVSQTDLVAALGNPDIQEIQVSKVSVP